MGWSIGYDDERKRDIGYGVPSRCDAPACDALIHRGIAFVCGGATYGGDHGCGLFFCEGHLEFTETRPQRCKRCRGRKKPYEPKPDVGAWQHHKLTHESWTTWRNENPEELSKLKKEFGLAD